MKKILLLVEGQTEFTFTDLTLRPHFETLNIFIQAKLVTTRRVKVGTHFKGGVLSYQQVKNEVTMLLHDTSAAVVTTLLDFYHLPDDFPGYGTMPRQNCHQRVAHLEQAWGADIAHQRFLPHLMLHEFETVLYTQPETIARAFGTAEKADELAKIVSRFNTIEEINELEAPSKRLLKIIPEYRKTIDGPLIADEIGLTRIRQACPHFNHWLSQLEQIGQVA